MGARTLIEEKVALVAENSFEFLTIPQTYRALQIILRGEADNSPGYQESFPSLRFNSDGGANYDLVSTYLYSAIGGDGVGIGNTVCGFGAIPNAQSVAGAPGLIEALIGNYTSTVFHKPVNIRAQTMKFEASNQYLMRVMSARWRSTAPITDLKISLGAGINFIAGTVVSLYGFE